MRSSVQIVRVSSALRATPETLWQHSATLRGLNEELWPLHMSGPSDVAFDSVPVGEPLFRSVLSVLRMVALDLHEFRLLRVSEGQGFHESSRSLLERRWDHIRTISAEPGGCLVTDELEFEPRLLPSVIAFIVRHTFERRHAFLRRKFGELIERN